MTTRNARRLLWAGSLLAIVLALSAHTHRGLASPGGPRPLSVAAASPHDPEGATAFRDNGCYSCHQMGRGGGALGPDLTHVGSRLSYEVIDAILVAPRSVDPLALMPAPELAQPERRTLARYLAAAK